MTVVVWWQDNTLAQPDCIREHVKAEHRAYRMTSHDSNAGDREVTVQMQRLTSSHLMRSAPEHEEICAEGVLKCG